MILIHPSKPTVAVEPTQGWRMSCGKGGKQIPQTAKSLLPFPSLCVWPNEWIDLLLPSPVIPNMLLGT